MRISDWSSDVCSSDLSDLIKVASLLAGLITFAGLIRHSELTAIWGACVSQGRLFRHLLPIAALLGGLQFVVDDLAVPASEDALTDWGVGEYRHEHMTSNGKEFTLIHAGTHVVRVHTAGIRYEARRGGKGGGG